MPMAVTKIWNVKDSLRRIVDYAMNPEKTANDRILQHDLTQVLHYAENADKTDHFCYVTGINCIPETAAAQTAMTKQRFGKVGGNVAFHAYQSFKPGEVAPEQCHQIGVELAQRLWGSRFEVVVATHLNTGCLYNHFVLNSVSFLDGKRYNDCNESYYKFRAMSGAICRKHGLFVIEEPYGTKIPRSVYLAEQTDRSTCYSLMRQDIDDAIHRSFTERFFYAGLRRMGYLVRCQPNRKYNTLQIPGTKYPTRFKTLGERYTEDAIRERILQNQRPAGCCRRRKSGCPKSKRTASILRLREDLKRANAVIDRSEAVVQGIWELPEKEEKRSIEFQIQ